MTKPPEEIWGKTVIGFWYDERLKTTVQLSALTLENSKEPKREVELAMAILSVYPEAGGFVYNVEKIGVRGTGKGFFPKMFIYTVIERTHEDKLTK